MMEVIYKKTAINKVSTLLMDIYLDGGEKALQKVDYISVTKSEMVELKDGRAPCMFNKADEFFFYVAVTEHEIPRLQHFPITCKVVE